MSLLVETLVSAFSPLLQDGLTWKAECSVGRIINLQPFRAAMTSSVRMSGMMHLSKSKMLVGTSKVTQLSIRSFIMSVSIMLSIA